MTRCAPVPDNQHGGGSTRAVRRRGKSGLMATTKPRLPHLAAAQLAVCAVTGGVAGELVQSTASSADTRLRLTATMDYVVQVDEPFTISVRLWNPDREPVTVMIRHHRELEFPFVAVFENDSRDYRTALVPADDKTWFDVRSWYWRCLPGVPRSDCPPLRNAYEVDGGEGLQLAESVRLSDYESWLRQEFGSGFVPGPHRMTVSVFFVENPEPYMLDVRNDIGRPLTTLDAEVEFMLETGEE